MRSTVLSLNRWRLLGTLLLSTGFAAACGGDDEHMHGPDDMHGDAAGIMGTEDIPPCPAETPEFRSGPAGIGLEVASESKAITARVLAATPAAPRRYRNDWTVQFLDAAGAPLNDVTVQSACGWMYVHNHGAPAKGIMQLADPSTFQLEHLNLFMRGPWDVELVVSSARLGGSAVQNTKCDERKPGADKIRIPVCVMDQ